MTTSTSSDSVVKLMRQSLNALSKPKVVSTQETKDLDILVGWMQFHINDSVPYDTLHSQGDDGTNVKWVSRYCVLVPDGHNKKRGLFYHFQEKDLVTAEIVGDKALTAVLNDVNVAPNTRRRYSSETYEHFSSLGDAAGNIPGRRSPIDSGKVSTRARNSILSQISVDSGIQSRVRSPSELQSTTSTTSKYGNKDVPLKNSLEKEQDDTFDEGSATFGKDQLQRLPGKRQSLREGLESADVKNKDVPKKRQSLTGGKRSFHEGFELNDQKNKDVPKRRHSFVLTADTGLMFMRKLSNRRSSIKFNTKDLYPNFSEHFGTDLESLWNVFPLNSEANITVMPVHNSIFGCDGVVRLVIPKSINGSGHKESKEPTNITVKVLHFREKGHMKGMDPRWLIYSIFFASPIDLMKSRSMKSLYLSVLEARDLPVTDSVVEISLNNIPFARTEYKYKTNEPFWGETFHLDSLEDSMKQVNVSLCNRKKKIVLRSKALLPLSYVNLKLEELARVGSYEEWFVLKPISHEPKYNAEENVPSIRLKIQCSKILLLPLKTFSDFQCYLSKHYEDMILVIQPLVACKDMESLSHSLIKIFMYHNLELELLKNLCRIEINQTDRPELMFRSNSFASKAFDQYMKLTCRIYLQRTLANFINLIYESKHSCEVDSVKLENSNKLESNQKRLLYFVDVAWQAIILSAPLIPLTLRHLFYFIRIAISSKFGSLKTTQYTSISGLLFLRLLCPAIMSPHLFHLNTEHPNPMQARTLTLVAKTIQNLANFKESSSKEPFMNCTTKFIANNTDAMKGFLDTASTTICEDETLAPSMIPIVPVDVVRELSNMRDFFRSYVLTLRDMKKKSDSLSDAQKEFCLAINDIVTKSDAASHSDNLNDSKHPDSVVLDKQTEEKAHDANNENNEDTSESCEETCFCIEKVWCMDQEDSIVTVVPPDDDALIGKLNTTKSPINSDETLLEGFDTSGSAMFTWCISAVSLKAYTVDGRIFSVSWDAHDRKHILAFTSFDDANCLLNILNRITGSAVSIAKENKYSRFRRLSYV